MPPRYKPSILIRPFVKRSMKMDCAKAQYDSRNRGGFTGEPLGQLGIIGNGQGVLEVKSLEFATRVRDTAL